MKRDLESLSLENQEDRHRALQKPRVWFCKN